MPFPDQPTYTTQSPDAKAAGRRDYALNMPMHTHNKDVHMTYLHRHRPICAVIAEIRELAVIRNDEYTVTLCDEARDYAQRMSVKLTEYKNELKNNITLRY